MRQSSAKSAYKWNKELKFFGNARKQLFGGLVVWGSVNKEQYAFKALQLNQAIHQRSSVWLPHLGCLFSLRQFLSALGPQTTRNRQSPFTGFISAGWPFGNLVYVLGAVAIRLRIRGTRSESALHLQTRSYYKHA
jgi:hypothetical protein